MKNLAVAPTKKATTISEIIESLTGIIPEEIRGQDPHGNDTALFGTTRLSTAIAFHDQSNILIWGRPAELQANENNAWDIFGAIAFNNVSLPYKTPADFLKAKILKQVVCNGLAIELSNDESCIMQVSLIKVSTKDLESAVVEGKSFIISIDEAKKSKTKTSKLELALKNLGLFYS